jgi:hypothetical protein
VYAMWYSGSNRATNAKYTVNFEGGVTDTTVNQQLNGGQWMSLGTFTFNAAGYSVVLHKNTGGVVIADAIQLVYVGSSVYHILTIASGPGGTTSPAPGTYPYAEGSGVQVQASADSVYQLDHWMLDGNNVGSANPYTVTMDADHNLEAVFEVIPLQPTIVDNADPGFSVVGSWTTSTQNAGTGRYYGPSYSYNFAGTGSDTATWSFTIPQAGQWQVYAMWYSGSNRATNAKYTVNYEGGSAVVTVNQQVNGGVWNILGTYNFDAASYSVVLNDNANNVVVADAIHLVYVGSAVMHDLTIVVSGSGTTDPTAGGPYSYAEGSNVQVTATPAGGWSLSKWVIDSVDVTLTNPYIITMEADHSLTAVFVELPPSTEIIVDDVDASFVGAWGSGSSPGYYGVGYRYRWAGSGSNTATWSFNVAEAGSWEVFAMWSSGTNRATDAPYTINHAGGSDTVGVNQQLNGGQWFSLGTYSFDAASYSIILNDNANGVVIADAIRLVYVGSP